MSKPNPYRMVIPRNADGESDVYDILKAAMVNDPAVAHAIKKLLFAGRRTGGKTWAQDLAEAIPSIQRALDLAEPTDTFKEGP